MPSDHQLNIPNLYNIPTGNVKKLVTNVFDKENYVFHYEKPQTLCKTLFDAMIRTKKILHKLESINRNG